MSGLRDVPEDTYHADRSTLSVSGAKILLKSPARFRYAMDNPTHSETFDFGHVAHELILGKGGGFRVLDHDSYRSKDSRDERDQAYAEGLTPILASEFERAMALAEAVRGDEHAAPYLAQGRAETAMYGVHADTGVGLRGRADWLTKKVDGTWVIVDVKTCASSEPDAIDRAMHTFGYAQQAAWYLDLLALNGHPGAEFVFIFAEKATPHFVQVAEPSASDLDYGRQKNEKAIRLYAECAAADHWPALPPHTTHVPAWAWKDLDDDE